MKKKLAILTIFLTAVFASQASGLDWTESRAYLGPQFGFYKSADADDTKLLIGGVLRGRIHPALGLEASLSYRNETFHEGRLEVTSWPVMLTGMVYPLPIVYGLMGVGWYNSSFDYLQAQDRNEQEFGWHFGGGLEWPVGGNSKFYTDIRYVFLDYEFDAIPGLEDTNSNFYMVSAGLLFGL
jgi:hypothetical protein